MGKVFIHVTMSLDGFIARPDGEIAGWAFNSGTDEMATGVMEEIGSVIMGNRGIKEGRIDENTIPYGGLVKVPQFVVTHTPREPITIGGLTFTFVGSIEQAIAQAKVAAGDKSVALLGASIDQQALKAGLVDEMMIHLVPVLLGDGIRLFDHLGNGDIKLERTEIVAASGITSLRFKILK